MGPLKPLKRSWKKIVHNLHGFHYLEINAENMGNNHDKIEREMEKGKYDLMGVTETWCNASRGEYIN